VLEDSQLPALLLLLPFVMESQDGFVHNPCQHSHLLYLLFFRHSPQFILKRNSNFGFQETFLLLATCSTKVPKPIEFAKSWNFEFRTGSGTIISAQNSRIWELFLECTENERFETEENLRFPGKRSVHEATKQP
jgi:hypothetical protein